MRGKLEILALVLGDIGHRDAYVEGHGLHRPQPRRHGDAVGRTVDGLYTAVGHKHAV